MLYFRIKMNVNICTHKKSNIYYEKKKYKYITINNFIKI